MAEDLRGITPSIGLYDAMRLLRSLALLNNDRLSQLLAPLITASGFSGGGGGTVIRNGSGAPGNGTTATAGDYYFDTTNGVMYGPVSGTQGAWTWGSGTNLKGTNGNPGVDASPIMPVSTQTGNYTLVTGDSSTLIRINSATDVTITLPNNLAVGFAATIMQVGVGKAVFSAASGATLYNRLSYTKTAGQHALVSLLVGSNAGGAAAAWNLSGDGV